MFPILYTYTSSSINPETIDFLLLAFLTAWQIR